MLFTSNILAEGFNDNYLQLGYSTSDYKHTDTLTKVSGSAEFGDDFYLNGDEPGYVDMPIWYTHNIKNIGEDTLYTNFWINEPYNLEDTDTFFEEV